MREFSTPLTVEIPATGNLTDDVVRNAREAADAGGVLAGTSTAAGTTSPRPRSSPRSPASPRA